MRTSPCLHCEQRKVTDDYNCHSPGNCKAYDEFRDYRELINSKRNEYQKGKVTESMAKLKKVGRPAK